MNIGDLIRINGLFHRVTSVDGDTFTATRMLPDSIAAKHPPPAKMPEAHPHVTLLGPINVRRAAKGLVPVGPLAPKSTDVETVTYPIGTPFEVVA